MEARAVSHPPEDVLLALGAGKLDDATADAIFFHVEVCPECLKIAGRQSNDSFLNKLRAARGNSGTPAPSKGLTTFPPAEDAAFVVTTSELHSPTILPELRDHPQYEVLRELGRGGMGIVYLAKNKLMDRKEVLKVVNKQLIGDAGATERFLREIRSAAQLIHPNIVTAFSALQAGELLLFSMEYIEGRDLAEVVKSRGPLPAAHSGSYVLQAARGLQHAFEKGMVHRDIKPQNLILEGKKNIVKILDFGLAKATRATTQAPRPGLTGLNMMMGTPDYMAPEQARDATNVDIRADIYSLGCTLYCLLAGRAPFVGGSLAAKIAAHQLSEPDPIESLRSDLPPGLAEIVRKMMAKDPEQRYQKPDEVVQALTVCFKGKGKQATPKAAAAKVVTATPVASQLSIKRASKSIFEKQTIAPIAVPRQTMRESPSPVIRLEKKAPARQRKNWLIAAGAAAALILMGLIALGAAGVFKVKTADGVLVVNVNEPNAEVFVDGDRMTVSWNDGGKKAEIYVKPGTRKVEVKKDGFGVDGTDLTFRDGDRVVFTARLLPNEPRMAKADAAPEKSPPPDTTKTDAVQKEGGPVAEQSAIRIFEGHREPVTRVLFTPDGSRLVSASNGNHYEGRSLLPGKDNTVRIWNVETGNVKQVLGVNVGWGYGPYGIAVSADGQLVAACTSWDSHHPQVQPAVFVWDAANGTRKQCFELPLDTPPIRSVGFSKDCKAVFALQGNPSVIHSWSVADGSKLKERPLVDVNPTGWLPAGSAFVGEYIVGPCLRSPDAPRAVYLWDRNTGELIKSFAGHEGFPTCCTMSLDGSRILSCGNDSSVRLWAVESGRQILCLDNDKLASNTGCVAISFDGKRFLTGGDDHMVRLWDSSTGKELARFEGHTDNINCVAFSPDGTLAASGSNDTTIRLWKLPPLNHKDAPAIKAPDRATTSPDSDGFVPLFNSKDLTGWDMANSHQTEWSVSDGILIGKNLGPTGPKNVGLLLTKRNDYANFHLRMKTMICDGQNCNLAFRVGENLDNLTNGVWPRTYLLNLGGTILSDAEKKQTIGSITDCTGKRHGEAVNVGLTAFRWYEMELIATGGRFKVLIDGTQVLDCEDGANAFPKGRFGLQCRPHTVVKFENIEIKELK